MRRREFIAGLSGTAMLVPAMAQSRPLVGLMGVGSARNSDMLLAPIREGLRRSGLVEGQDFDLEQRWAEGEYQRFPDITRDFVRRGVSVIIAGGGAHSQRWLHDR